MFLFAVNHFFIVIIFPRSSFEHIHLFAHSLQATRGKYKTDLGKTPRRQKQGSACVERFLGVKPCPESENQDQKMMGYLAEKIFFPHPHISQQNLKTSQ